MTNIFVTEFSEAFRRKVFSVVSRVSRCDLGYRIYVCCFFMHLQFKNHKYVITLETCRKKQNLDNPDSFWQVCIGWVLSFEWNLENRQNHLFRVLFFGWNCGKNRSASRKIQICSSRLRKAIVNRSGCPPEGQNNNFFQTITRRLGRVAGFIENVPAEKWTSVKRGFWTVYRDWFCLVTGKFMRVPMIYQTSFTFTQYQYIHSTLLSVLKTGLEKNRFIQSDACVCFHNLLESDEITTRWQLSISLTLSSEHLWEFPEIFRSQSDFVIENYISHSSITCALKLDIMTLNSSYNKIRKLKLRQFNYFCTTCS